MDKRVLRTGTWVIVCAIILRLLSGIPYDAVFPNFSGTELASLVIFLQTGRRVRPAQVVQFSSQVLEATEPEQTQPPQETVSFSESDAALVSIHNECGYRVDISQALQQSLRWDLNEADPAVLILHTHGSEAYCDQAGYRTEDTALNVVAVGELLAQELEAGGIRVIHDRTLHDIPSYNGSYTHARSAAQAYLEQYPSIRLILDIHRDAAEDASGKQIHYTVETEQGKAAKLMLVVGTDAGGWEHPAWQENFALAVKLHTLLQKSAPDICRPISFRSSRFNQDLSPGALLVEVGAAGNTREEALLAARQLANSIISLAQGANW